MNQNRSSTTPSYLLVIFLFFGVTLYAQNFVSSNLPIVLIETDPGFNGIPQRIPDDPKVFGTMTIIKRPNNARNFVSDVNNDDYIDYRGRIKIETRGSSSQTLPKKPYGFSTLSDDDTENDNVKLLGLPKENDWIFNSFAFDDSMMRDFISYQIAREMGHYATKLVYCEVIVNGDYRGLYALSEKIKQDSKRVNISNLSDDDLTSPDITGGYIIKTDKPNGDPVAWWGNGKSYFHHDPSPKKIVGAQSRYIESIFRRLDQTQNNSDIASGYPSVIDVPSFIDYMLVAELSSNVDSYEYSTYFHKDKRGKLRAGPVWDFNLTYGNDVFMWGYDRSFTNVWQFDNRDNVGAPFWKALFNNSEYRCYLSKRFNELSVNGETLSYSYLSNLIDNTRALIGEAVVRENQRWNTIPNFDRELRNMKFWLQRRISWMRDNLGDNARCSNVATPALTITKIHYNPQETDEFPEEEDQEFIELQNTGNSTIDLTGIYFSKLGLSYQFPAGSTIGAGEKIHLAADAVVFEEIHNLVPFGEFSRDLSNKEQNIVLADAFGNVIDEVTYSDKAPWPEEVDGDGPWLEVIDTRNDNSNPNNWRSSNGAILIGGATSKDRTHSFSMYPNPTSSILYVWSESIISKIQIVSLAGQVLFTKDVNRTSSEIPVFTLKEGFYMVKLTLGATNEEVTKQFVKRN